MAARGACEYESNAPCKTAADTVGLRNDLENLFDLAQAGNSRFANVVDETKRMKEESKKEESNIKTLRRARVENLESCLGAERLMETRRRRGQVGYIRVCRQY